MRKTEEIHARLRKVKSTQDNYAEKLKVEMLLDIRDILDELCTELKSFAQYIKERR